MLKGSTFKLSELAESVSAISSLKFSMGELKASSSCNMEALGYLSSKAEIRSAESSVILSYYAAEEASKAVLNGNPSIKEAIKNDLENAGYKAQTLDFI